jgi:CRISPR/Cas system-associated exonuclease Cas4 (RecB family)
MTKMEDEGWKQKLSAFRKSRASIIRGGELLRFGSRFVKVSDIAHQFYCEKKVELGRIYGLKETRLMKKGAEAHEKLLEGSVPATEEIIWEHISFGKPVTVREMMLVASYKGVSLVGVADAVCFRKGLPTLLLEHKFTSKQVLYTSYQLQAWSYCFILGLMDFDTSRLKYAVILVPPEAKGDEFLERIDEHLVRNSRSSELTFPLRTGQAKVFMESFDQRSFIMQLDWALEFWKQSREAVPTRNPQKCKVCEFREMCEFSLARTAGSPPSSVSGRRKI